MEKNYSFDVCKFEDKIVGQRSVADGRSIGGSTGGRV